MGYATSSLYDNLFGEKKGGKGGKRVKGGSAIQYDSITSYLIGGGSGGTSELFTLLNQKKEFFILIFANLIVQLGITYYVMMNYNFDISITTRVIFVLFQFLLIFILALIPMPTFIKFLLFCVFSASFGVLLSSLKKEADIKIIETAVVGTMGIFASMLIAGVFLILMGIKLSIRFGLGLMYLLLILILSSIVFMFMNTYSTYNKIFMSAGLFLFSMYIIYDTNSILQKNYYGDFITASMDYYLDILNIFIRLIGFNNN